jgi:dTDP-4-amino-4,6-dideoxygalactose transaminase
MIEYENLAKLNEPFFNEFRSAFNRALEGGWYILGKEVSDFEREFAAYCQQNYCAGVASGLDALILALKALNLPEGSEVIVPSNTYIATILAILQNGFKPILVEPDIATYNIDPARIQEKITANTRAIIVVHLYGRVCEMNPILKICQEFNLKLIEDCAQAHGAKYKNRLAGGFGDFGAFSFYPTKNLGAIGDAGAITYDNPEYDRKVRMLRNYGSEKKYYNDVIGFNSRLDEVQAAFLRVKLRRLDEINSRKNELAKIYLRNLKDDFVKPVTDPDYYHVYHIFNIRHQKRDQLREYLLQNQIKTEVHYPVAPHKQKAMEGLIDKDDYSISEEIHRTTLSLPISYFHRRQDIERVVEVMNSF